MEQALGLALVAGLGLLVTGCSETASCPESLEEAFSVTLRVEGACTLPDDLAVRMCADERCADITLDSLSGPDDFDCTQNGNCTTPDEYGEYLSCSWAREPPDGTVGTFDASASGYVPLHTELTARHDSPCHTERQHADALLASE